MYRHVVLFHLKDRAEIPATVDVLSAMGEHIPSLKHVHVGADDSPGPRSADICLITVFADRAGYDAYHTHPHHQDVVLAHMKGVTEKAIKVDWG